MSILASFKDFLTTAHIGPLHTELTLTQVAKLLGRPGSWILQPNDTCPEYWTYGKLEISFDTSTPAPFHMRFFQIEFANSLEGDCEVFRGPDHEFLVLALDGLHGKSKPSDIVRAMRDGPPVTVMIRVSRSTRYVSMRMSNGLVDVLFGNGQLQHANAALIPAAGLARTMDAVLQLDSIYAYRKTDAATSPREPVDPEADDDMNDDADENVNDTIEHTISAAEYLEAIR
jgi:hypothetical protein